MDHDSNSSGHAECYAGPRSRFSKARSVARISPRAPAAVADFRLADRAYRVASSTRRKYGLSGRDNKITIMKPDTAYGGALWAFLAHEKKTPDPMIDLSLFSGSAFGYGSIGLLVCCITQRDHHVRHAFLSARRAQAFTDVNRDHLSRPIVIQHGVLAGERCPDGSYGRPRPFDYGRAIPDRGFPHRRQPSGRFPLDPSHHPAWPDGSRLGIL